MKSLSKLLLVGAVAVMAIAITAAPSEAKGKKKKAAPPCVPGALCTMPNTHVMACGGDGKWYQAIFTPICVGPICPPKC